MHRLVSYRTRFPWNAIACQSYLNVSIRKSVPDPMSTIHAIWQSVACHPLVIFVPPLGRHFGHCSLPSKGNLQPLFHIVTLSAPGSCFSTSWDFVWATKLRNVIAVIGCWCRNCAVRQMSTLHTQWEETTACCWMENRGQKLLLPLTLCKTQFRFSI